ncbi:MAG: SH3 domain-containing protein [Sphingomonas oligoaromativorans]|jgi:SH3-like domain-containing protein|uniref:SH3 domain-containing protein n=1 Tax=Sphingomonas oligoaromativorans TaxID=575322 RepID=UPI001FBBED77|nr:SH3 domain-containing protein [Sphingomonas oligoaromativorans]NIJ31902.1 SH3-like domain-containing protein [Sphingomonas oligoaromativorans]
MRSGLGMKAMGSAAKSVMMAAIAALAIGAGAEAASNQVRQTPYWGSISAGQARMRTGPGRNYPASWLYQRQGLPVQVIEVYPGWRKIRDPDGTEGWMIGNLVSDQRTGMVKGGVAELRDRPDPGSKVVWRAEPGVIGRLSKCAAGWCKFDVQGRGGYLEEARLWGVGPGETFD